MKAQWLRHHPGNIGFKYLLEAMLELKPLSHKAQFSVSAIYLLTYPSAHYSVCLTLSLECFSIIFYSARQRDLDQLAPQNHSPTT